MTAKCLISYKEFTSGGCYVSLYMTMTNGSSMCLALTFIFFSYILLSLVAGKVFPKNYAALLINSSKFISTFSLTRDPTSHNVKIIFPANGEKVPVGKSLVVSGISSGNINATYINCHVSIIVNGIKPYRTTTASGPNGADDYSKWRFSLTPTLGYHAIKVGHNKITAKYSCTNSPTSLSHYSVNVTGIHVSTGNITTAK